MLNYITFFTVIILLYICNFQLHTTDLDDDVGKINLKSITEESTLEEFLHYAELSDRQFTAGNFL